MEEVFTAVRDAVSEAEELLVDEGWRPVEIEPEAVPVNGNGHRDSIGIGPTVELVPGSGHRANANGQAAVTVNGNGHHDEAGEPQQTLFSWAEFIAAEPARSKRRRSKPQPASASLFEWVLTLEQEREAELVGAGR